MDFDWFWYLQISAIDRARVRKLSRQFSLFLRHMKHFNNLASHAPYSYKAKKMNVYGEIFLAFLWNLLLSLEGIYKSLQLGYYLQLLVGFSKICENGSFIFQSQVAGVRPLPKLHATNGGCPFKHFSVAQTLPWQLTRTTSDSTHTQTHTHIEYTLILTVGHKNTGYRPWQSINHVQNELESWALKQTERKVFKVGTIGKVDMLPLRSLCVGGQRKSKGVV